MLVELELLHGDLYFLCRQDCFLDGVDVIDSEGFLESVTDYIAVFECGPPILG